MKKRSGARFDHLTSNNLDTQGEPTKATSTLPVFLEIHSGSGGKEAEAWAEMLFRMYVKYASKQNWNVHIVSEIATPAGIKSAILQFPNKAKSLAISENGVHRLTRCSPFGNGKLQTSFASVHVLETIESKKCTLPRHEVEESFYRGSGPGGQHRNVEYNFIVNVNNTARSL